jgi:ubiquinone/menaquinone biosynthesis C-methylase UbiE
MGFHTFDPERADRLEDVSRFRFCSREELLEHLPRDGTVLDVGSGTGFYTDEIAPFVDDVLALDVQAVMHDRYRDRGVPDNVTPATADAEKLPFRDDAIDGAFSTMTFHESTTPAALSDLNRVLAPDSPFVVVDWSARGNGESGPSRDERFDSERARELLEDAGFTVDTAAERSETFRLLAAAGTA